MYSVYPCGVLCTQTPFLADNIDIDVSNVTLPGPLLEASPLRGTDLGQAMKEAKETKAPRRPPLRKTKDELVRPKNVLVFALVANWWPTPNTTTN